MPQNESPQPTLTLLSTTITSLEYLFFRPLHIVRRVVFVFPQESVSLHSVFETCPYPLLSWSNHSACEYILVARLCLVIAVFITPSLSAIHAVRDLFRVTLVTAVEWRRSYRFAAAVSACDNDSRPTSMRHGSPRSISSFPGQCDRRP